MVGKPQLDFADKLIDGYAAKGDWHKFLGGGLY